MTRHYNTQHLDRGISTYHRKGKANRADKYGNFDQGKQNSPDKIAGRSVWYPVKEDKENA